jgi:hypothetical protein
VSYLPALVRQGLPGPATVHRCIIGVIATTSSEFPVTSTPTGGCRRSRVFRSPLGGNFSSATVARAGV